MKSECLKKIQEVFEDFVKKEIDDPATDYKKLKKFVDVLETVDSFRRELYDEIAEQVVDELGIIITDDGIEYEDDIPF